MIVVGQHMGIRIWNAQATEIRLQDRGNIHGAKMLIRKEAGKEAMTAEVRTGDHSFIYWQKRPP
jgi:hypothetical protein